VDAQPIDFETWYQASHARLVASLLLVTGDLDLTRDAVDEACTRAYAKWDRVRHMDAPMGWTFRVALNVIRRRQRRAQLERRLLGRRIPEPSVPPPGDEAWAVVASLPIRQRTAVVLRHVADLTQDEIAAAMGVTRSTVASTLDDAHRNLRALLTETEMEPRDA
jgi:DNA-directed RNA polymerase specialized sigma24 family protein